MALQATGGGIVEFIVRHAAVNARRRVVVVDSVLGGRWADERGEPAAGTGRVWAAHPNPGRSARRCSPPVRGFFLAADKVQVKYEMLRAHLVDGLPVTEAAAAHGYSRAAFYLVSASFDAAGMAGLLDERRGRRGPVKLTPGDRGVHPRPPPGSGAELAEQVADRFGVRLHRRTVERARRPVTARSFWPPAEAAQVDYETLRAHLLEHGRLPDGLAAARFARRGLAGLIAWPVSRTGVRRRAARRAPGPAWTPHADPRIDALAAGYQFCSTPPPRGERRRAVHEGGPR